MYDSTTAFLASAYPACNCASNSLQTLVLSCCLSCASTWADRSSASGWVADRRFTTPEAERASTELPENAISAKACLLLTEKGSHNCSTEPSLHGKHSRSEQGCAC